MNGIESIMGAATWMTKLAEDTAFSPSTRATVSTRLTTASNSKSVEIAPSESFNQGFQMKSTSLSESVLGMTFNIATVVQTSRKTQALWNSLPTISILDVRGSATLEKINSTPSSIFVNASLPSNTSSFDNATEPYRRPVDDYSIVFYSIAFIAGITGNVFVLVDAFKTQKKLKTNEMLLIHLCLVNVFILSTLTPMVFLMKIRISSSCHVIFSLTILYQYGIVYTLTAISIQHHRAIACPFSPKPSGKRIAFTIVAIWVVSIFQVLPMVLTEDFLPRGCLIGTNKQLKIVRRKIYYSLLTFTQYLLPFFLIVMYYTKLSVFLKKARLDIERRTDSTHEVQSPRKKRNQRVVMVIVAMVATFAVSMLPQHIQFLLTEFVLEKTFPYGIAVFTFYPVVIKACLDPLIYGAVGRKLKSCSCCSRPTNSTQNDRVN
ncbi:RYamide receptor-like [Actinia tenebrosa]|uniref:RYamide receptor-like n=1 Tax=Actinia tenebrosa TaxID=6105 RepID=A0A6P8HNM2_ACTTE|nr:RYamide receptor-like [Actinia tenebrosa]